LSDDAAVEARPHLVTILEAVASIMGLNDGRLELVFEHGRLTRWWSHSEKRQARELGEFDSRAAYLTDAGDRPDDSS
jgi:hypothetical protein